MNKTRKILGWVLTALAAIMPAWGVIGKFSNEAMQTQMGGYGFKDWLTIIAIGELIAVVTFVLPKTGKIGILLLSALMGGAIATHMGNGESFMMQSIVLLMAWAATLLRYPEFLDFGGQD